MKRLILGLVLFAALAGLAHAQGNGNVVRLIGSGAPTGGCSPIMEWNDITNGNIYWCGSSNGGSSYGWLETNGGASFPLTSPSANPATSGELNLANNVDQVCWRNAANSADICIYVDNNNVFQFSGTGGISFDHATATSTTLPMQDQVCRTSNITPLASHLRNDVDASCHFQGAFGNDGPYTYLRQTATDTTTTHILHASATDAAGTFGPIAIGDLPVNPLLNVNSSLGASTGAGLGIPGSFTAGDVYYESSGGLALAKADNSSTLPGICLAVSTTFCVYSGVYRFSSSQSWTAGNILYISDAGAGALLTTAPSTSAHYVQRFGVALAADTIFIDPSLDVGGIQ